MTGFAVFVLIRGENPCRNAVVWPDEESAHAAGKDLLARWFVPYDYEVRSVDESPNRPTWDEWVTENGLPPRSVSL